MPDSANDILLFWLDGLLRFMRSKRRLIWVLFGVCCQASVAMLGASASVAFAQATPVVVWDSTAGTLTATIGNGPGNARDWVALFTIDAPTYLDWRY